MQVWIYRSTNKFGCLQPCDDSRLSRHECPCRFHTVTGRNTPCCRGVSKLPPRRVAKILRQGHLNQSATSGRFGRRKHNCLQAVFLYVAPNRPQNTQPHYETSAAHPPRLLIPTGSTANV